MTGNFGGYSRTFAIYFRKRQSCLAVIPWKCSFWHNHFQTFAMAARLEKLLGTESKEYQILIYERGLCSLANWSMYVCLWKSCLCSDESNNCVTLMEGWFNILLESDECVIQTKENSLYKLSFFISHLNVFFRWSAADITMCVYTKLNGN